MEVATWALALVAGLGLLQGASDVKTLISPSVSSGTFRARTAVVFASVATALGASVAGPLVAVFLRLLPAPTPPLVIAATLTALLWGLLSARLQVAASSTHAVVGGLLGALFAAHPGVSWPVLAQLPLWELHIGMLAFPPLAIAVSLALAIALAWAARHQRPSKVEAAFRPLQPLLALALFVLHGGTAAARITVLLLLVAQQAPALSALPGWVWYALAGGLSGLGALIGGLRAIRVRSLVVLRLRPWNAALLQLVVGGFQLLSVGFGAPASINHLQASGLLGLGAASGLPARVWGLTRPLLVAWLVTLPLCVGIGALLLRLLLKIGLA